MQSDPLPWKSRHVAGVKYSGSAGMSHFEHHAASDKGASCSQVVKLQGGDPCPKRGYAKAKASERRPTHQKPEPPLHKKNSFAFKESLCSNQGVGQKGSPARSAGRTRLRWKATAGEPMPNDKGPGAFWTREMVNFAWLRWEPRAEASRVNRAGSLTIKTSPRSKVQSRPRDLCRIVGTLAMRHMLSLASMVDKMAERVGAVLEIEWIFAYFHIFPRISAYFHIPGWQSPAASSELRHFGTPMTRSRGGRIKPAT